MDLEPGSPEVLEKRIALALGVTLGTMAETTYAALDDLYKRLRLGGGIFRAKGMTGELAKATRYELLPYLVALVTVLAEDWPKRTIPSSGFMSHLEKAIFSHNLEKTKLTYLYYLDRYYHPHHSDSTSLPSEAIMHSEFLQRLASIWSVSKHPTDKVPEYALHLGNLTRQTEQVFRSALSGIWP